MSNVPSEFQDQPEKATNRQISFIESLLDERDLLKSPKFFDAVNAMDQTELASYINVIKANLQDLSKKQASAYIERLLELPRKERQVADGRGGFVSSPDHGGFGGESQAYPGLPAGRYAIRNEEGVVKFYKVDRPDEGRWSGYVFFNALAGGPHGHPEEHPIKKHEAKRAIYEEIIAAGPREAAILYGQEIGECGVCGRTLTDETSRAYGIGPVCRENTGW